MEFVPAAKEGVCVQTAKSVENAERVYVFYHGAVPALPLPERKRETVAVRCEERALTVRACVLVCVYVSVCHLFELF